MRLKDGNEDLQALVEFNDKLTNEARESPALREAVPEDSERGIL